MFERYIKKICNNIKITDSRLCGDCCYKKIDFFYLWQDRLKINTNSDEEETQYIKIDTCYSMIKENNKVKKWYTTN